MMRSQQKNFHMIKNATEGAKRLRFSEFDVKHDPADVVFLARRFHEESRFNYIPFAPEKVEGIVERVLRNPKQEAILMCWDGERALGAVYCSAGEYHIGRGAIVTTFHSIFVLPEIRGTLLSGRVALRLMKGVESWSKARSAQEILFHATADIEVAKVHKLIKRVGYRFIGGSYAKSI